MSIVVETGTGLNLLANSYIGVQDARNFAQSRGLSVPCGNDALSQYLLRAMDYLATFDGMWKGYPASEDQPLAWPRSCVYIHNKLWAVDSIPSMLKYAQVHIALALSEGYDPLATVTNQSQVIEEQVDVIRVKYAAGVSNSGLPTLTMVDALLAPLLTGNGVKMQFVRV